MLSIQDFISYLKGLGIQTTMYPLAFPASAPKQSMIVEVGEGFASKGPVSEVILTITVRGRHPSEAESIAQKVNELLSNRTDDLLGNGYQIILIKSQQLLPNYLGKDADGSHYYMLNFRVLVTD